MYPSHPSRPRRALLAGIALGALAVPLVAASASAASDVRTLETTTLDTAAAALMGDNVRLVSAQLVHGREVQVGAFSGLDLSPAIGSGLALSTGSLRAADPAAAADVDFTASSLTGTNTKATTTGDLGGVGSAELTALTGSTTYDAAQVALTVVPAGDTLSIVYQFGSEEYPTWAQRDYTDALGIFVNGTLCSVVGGEPAGIRTINETSHADSFVSNLDGSHATEMNAYTTALTCTVAVQPGVETTIVAAVGDTVDGQLDTTLLLAASGIASTPAVVQPTASPTGSDPAAGGGTTGAPAGAAGTGTQPQASGALARTGGDSGLLIGAITGGALLAAAGAGLVLRSSRRSATEADGS
ncbi:hypothetical protein JOE53_002373 [Microbacterium laevaniformans]|uniref:choice-of-anchor L domain-containing protein n=1 Tax=Microbacterium laevaniformans TaxID=36807 RepID=UPI00195CFEB1|nr:choice-of-anchor L domain-containing protein [Microbacterium laevaniformans]MBM7753653.1 hypothetical protein [Microbacterium laevaniformans]